MSQIEQAVSDLQRLCIALGRSLDGHTVGVVCGFLEGLAEDGRKISIESRTGGVVVEVTDEDGTATAKAATLVGCLATLAEGPGN